jgi:hypothetical protein
MTLYISSTQIVTSNKMLSPEPMSAINPWKNAMFPCEDISPKTQKNAIFNLIT